MKALVLALALAFAGTAAWANTEPKETKKVCVDVMKDGKPVKDAKGNVKQNCKEVKVHKKLEGTKVPEKK
jgi:uncharacterized protein YcfJ